MMAVRIDNEWNQHRAVVHGVQAVRGSAVGNREY